MSDFPSITQISDFYIKPKYEVPESKQFYSLTHWDLIFLSFHYNQRGLLYPKPKPNFCITTLLESLKDSLALALVHFYPFAGQLDTKVDQEKHQSLVFLDCNKGPGARVVHASLDGVTISDLLCGNNIPHVVDSFFDHFGDANYDGHTKSLLTIQVTELVDGVFIGCSMNHAIADGATLWHFWSVWSKIQRAQGILPISVSDLPSYERWFPDGYGPNDVVVPYTHPNEFISRFKPPQLTQKMFCFTSNIIKELKSKANEDIINTNNSSMTISSFQALAAFVWRCIIRSNKLKPNQTTHCKLVSNSRGRVQPPLSEKYFGNTVDILTTTTTVDNLLGSILGNVGLLLHRTVANHTDEAVRDYAKAWYESPCVYQYGGHCDSDGHSTVLFGSSHRFEMYENEFDGVGKPIGVFSGFSDKFSGKVIVCQGFEGVGSIDLEICLEDECMRVLESDPEFLAMASIPNYSQDLSLLLP